MLYIPPLLFYSNVLAHAIMIHDRLNTTICQSPLKVKLIIHNPIEKILIIEYDS